MQIVESEQGLWFIKDDNSILKVCTTKDGAIEKMKDIEKGKGGKFRRKQK